MTSTDINELLKDFYLSHDDFKNSTVENLSVGFNRAVYLLKTTAGDKYIVMFVNDSKDLGSSNVNDVMVQSFLAEMVCKFVPRIIYWDSTNDLYIESYVGEQDVEFNSLEDDWIDLFAKQLTFVHGLSTDQFQKFSVEHGYDKPEVASPIDSLKTYGFARFEIVKKLCPDEHVINWLDKHLRQNLSDLEKRPSANTSHVKWGSAAGHLKWGDIGENLRKDDSNLYFINWQFAGLGYGSELPYIKIHSHLSSDKFNYLVSRYAVHNNTTDQELFDEINLDEKIIRTNDVVWAAMKWGQSESADDIEKYKTLTYERIDLAQ